jgi:geranylgeranyl pyrophosphate synthase
MKQETANESAPIAGDWRTDAKALRRRMDELAATFEARLRGYVAEATREGVPNLHDAMSFALGCDIDDPALRGKRVRPLLCLLTAEALGAPAERAMPFALAIELMHNFALVHDDIQDGDIMRRGRDSAWRRYGMPHAINIGDYLLVHAFRVLVDWPDAALDAVTRARLVALIGAALDHTHIGQALEMNHRGTREISEEEYLRVAREKTGHYLAAPIQGGAIVAGADEATLATIAEMAMFLGPLFQVMDDVIDLTSGKGREAIGSDVREGKRSFLVARVATTASDEERRRLFDVLDKPREETTREDVAWVVALFEKHGTMAAGRQYCRDLHERSRAALAGLPAALGAPLGLVFEMLVNRDH